MRTRQFLLSVISLCIAGCSQQTHRVPVCPLPDELPLPVGDYRVYEPLEGVGKVPVAENWDILKNSPTENRLELESSTGMTLRLDLECCSAPEYLRQSTYSNDASGRPIWLKSDNQEINVTQGFLFPTAYVNPLDLEQDNIVFRSPPRLDFFAECGQVALKSCQNAIVSIIQGIRFDASARADTAGSAITDEFDNPSDIPSRNSTPRAFEPPASSVGLEQTFTPALC